MDPIDFFYENRPRNTLFYPRKLRLPNGSFILYGARGVGKTALILDYLASMREDSVLYIDCQDPIFALEEIDIEEIEEFIATERIELLVLDHWFDSFLSRIPKSCNTVIVSRVLPKNFALPAFELFALDYEEFLTFDRGNSPSQSFSRFLKSGTLPSINSVKSSSALLALRAFFYEKFDELESRLLLIIARFHGRRATTHQIYSSAKEYFRISKDWTYKTLKNFENEKVVIRIEDLLDGGSKIYIYDFILSRYLNRHQPFAVTFDAMIAIALYKHGKEFVGFGSGAYLLKYCNELVISSPFESKESLLKKIGNIVKKSQIGLSKISVVSVSNRYSAEYEGIAIETLPYYEWSILND
jgi:predicted AAA+ superfamily ATPase